MRVILLTRCNFFTYNWKLPAYSGPFLLTVDNFSFFYYSWSFFDYNISFLLTVGAFLLTVGKFLLIRALKDCKQQRSLTFEKDGIWGNELTMKGLVYGW